MEKILLEEAYRKLKGSVFLDKTVPFLRADIAAYENAKFDEKIEKLFMAVNDGEEWDSIENKILNSIRAYTFPKKLADRKIEEEGPIVISNVGEERFIVEKYNNFIDMQVEGHILGVLWILLIGYKMDKDLHANCFGNRLSETLVFEEGKATASPNLFKPYFGQYESWRNLGLSQAEKTVNSDGQSVIITMLDLTRYYYNIDLPENSYVRLTSKYCKRSDMVVQRVNSFVYKVIKKYSECLGNGNKTMLPIGFLPSNILANVYLRDFDNALQCLDSTVYFGRYVDDIILITKIEKSHLLRRRIVKNGIEEVSKYIIELLKKSRIIYDEDNEIGLVGYPYLKVQKSKFKFFYVDKNGYDTIINKIKKDIYKNSSEFRYLPEEMTSDLNEDIFKLERDDSVNKLRAINGVTINKYALSKTLGKNIMMSKFAEDKAVDSFIENIEQVLNNYELINNYILWESILNFYVLNAKWDKIEDFTTLFLSALNSMDEETGKDNPDYSYLRSETIDSVGDSLIRYYHSCLVRATAIIWGREINEVLTNVSNKVRTLTKYLKYVELFQVGYTTDLRKKSCHARLINQSLLPVTIEECMETFKPNDKSDLTIRFNDLQQYLLASEKVRYSRKMRMYAPYIRSPFDILYTNLLKQIKNGVTELMSDYDCADFVIRNYADNFGNKECKYISEYIKADYIGYDENYLISIATQDKKENGKVRVAVANVKMRQEDVKDILQGTKRNLATRCAEISKILREAIQYKSDILIFPEAYIPITYLPYLEKKSRDNNMVIIGGLEHIRVRDKVYNFTVTILPMIQNRLRYTVPFFHLKKYYSPKEEKVIKEYDCEAITGNSHTLFEWKGIRFTTYCCYELTSIEERSIFKRKADIIFGVEWNADTDYFSNIMESLCRDISCYCIQSNMSEFGDSRIIQPSKKVSMNIARVKGGANGLAIIDDIDINKIRSHHKTGTEDGLKPLPAGWEN